MQTKRRIVISAVVIIGSYLSCLIWIWTKPAPVRPGSYVCYTPNGIEMISGHSDDIIYHNTHGLTFLNDRGAQTQVSSQYCSVSLDNP
ncbi:MAG: hypothetical protein WC761_02015 [Candidatus Paceibacterota bacterium]|jgi:hypothetical protein